MSGKDKKTLSRSAVQSVKKRTEELIEDDDLDIDAELDEVSLLDVASSHARSSSSRRQLEDYLEERRLRRELSDDFDY